MASIITNGRYTKLCMHGASCVKYGCNFSHPPERPQDCPKGASCRDQNCKLHHPRKKKDILCRFGKNCKTIGCPFNHSSGDSTSVQITCLPVSTPCMHGKNCIKFGCPFAHPTSRRPDCPHGSECSDINCHKIHPLPKTIPSTKKMFKGGHHTQNPTKKVFKMGQNVQAQIHKFTAWRPAVIKRVQPSSLTRQFDGWGHNNEVPYSHVRNVKTSAAKPKTIERKASENKNIESKIAGSWSAESKTSEFSDNLYKVVLKTDRFEATPGREKSTASSIANVSLSQLEARKLAATKLNNYKAAACIASQIATLSAQIEALENDKKEAVLAEDFLLAAYIKNKINKLSGGNNSTDKPSIIQSCGSEAREEKIEFSLFSSSTNNAWRYH